MYVRFCVALLALSSLTAAADPDCEELTKPLEDQSQVAGKWIYHVGTSDNPDFLKELQTVNSSWITLTAIPDSDQMTLRFADRIVDGKCLHGSVNSTTSGNTTKVTFVINAVNYDHTGKNLKTCDDCILWTDDSVRTENGEVKKGRYIYLFTKPGKQLDDAELEVFKKQAACLNFPADFHFGDKTNPCPEEKEAAADEQ